MQGEKSRRYLTLVTSQVPEEPEEPEVAAVIGPKWSVLHSRVCGKPQSVQQICRCATSLCEERSQGEWVRSGLPFRGENVPSAPRAFNGGFDRLCLDVRNSSERGRDPIYQER